MNIETIKDRLNRRNVLIGLIVVFVLIGLYYVLSSQLQERDRVIYGGTLGDSIKIGEERIIVHRDEPKEEIVEIIDNKLSENDISINSRDNVSIVNRDEESKTVNFVGYRKTERLNTNQTYVVTPVVAGNFTFVVSNGTDRVEGIIRSR